DPGPAGLDRGRAAADPRFDRDPRQRWRRRVVEIAGGSHPAGCRLSDQEGVVRQNADLSCQFRYEVLMSVVRWGFAPLVLLVMLCGWLGGAEAQQNPPAPAASPGTPPALSILVVDVQSLLQNSKSAKMVRQQI